MLVEVKWRNILFVHLLKRDVIWSGWRFNIGGA
jgi:hypothetical protein